MKFHKDGSLPRRGEIFVFGSNVIGIHGAGAALVARKKYGAVIGLGSGPMSQCYAIPTKRTPHERLHLDAIAGHVAIFLSVADRTQGDLEYFVTRIGCGYAGYKDLEMAPLFRGAPSNCSFAEEWRECLQ